MGSRQKTESRRRALWEKQRDSLKTRWVVAVMAFWVSAAVMAAVYFIEHRVDFILASICLGLMLVGLWLKTRFQAHLRAEPPAPVTDGSEPPD